MSNSIILNKKNLDIIMQDRSRTRLYSCSNVPNLSVRINKNRVVFVVSKLINKRSKQIKIGEYPLTSICEAKDKTVEVLRNVQNGLYDNEVNSEKHGIVTFNDLFYYYYNNYAKINKKSYEKDERMYQRYLKKYLEHVKIKNLSRDVIKSVLNTVIDRKHTYNLCIALLSKVFNFSIENNLIKDNFVKNVKKIKVDHIVRFLSEDEFSSLMNVLNTDDYAGTDIKLLVMLGLTTGLRSCNLKSIKISDINLDLNEIYVELTKNGTPVIVPISNSVKILIEEKISKVNGSSIYLFPGRLSNEHLIDFKGSFKTLLKNAGIVERFRIHDMRHTFASMLAKNGATLQTIQKALNHKSIHMTMKYAHLCDKDVRSNILSVMNSNF